jgi:hypothetical protein
MVPGGIEQLPGRERKSAESMEVAGKSRDSSEAMDAEPMPKSAPKGRKRGRKFKPV